MFSGLTVKFANVTSNTTTNGDKINVCLFPYTSTVVNTYIAAQSALTTTTTNWVMFRMLNGGTTGNVTTRALFRGGSNQGNWVANTWRQITTHYTFNAGNSLAVRYSEQGTVAVGWWTLNAHYVDGNV